MTGSAVPALVAAAWTTLVAAVVVRHRPPPARLRPADGDRRRRGSGLRPPLIGRAVLRLLPRRWRPKGGADIDDEALVSRVGLTTLAGLAGVLLAGPLVAVSAGAATWFAPVVIDRRRVRRKREAALAGLPEIVDLLAVAVGTGLTVGQAIDAVGRRATGPLAAELGAVLDRVERGFSLADSLELLPARVGDGIRPLSSALAACERYGSPVGPALERLSTEVRAARRRQAEAAARRVPVKLLFPLVGCILPAFALLTVAPLVASAAGSLRLTH